MYIRNFFHFFPYPPMTSFMTSSYLKHHWSPSRSNDSDSGLDTTWSWSVSCQPISLLYHDINIRKLSSFTHSNCCSELVNHCWLMSSSSYSFLLLYFYIWNRNICNSIHFMRKVWPSMVRVHVLCKWMKENILPFMQHHMLHYPMEIFISDIFQPNDFLLVVPILHTNICSHSCLGRCLFNEHY